MAIFLINLLEAMTFGLVVFLMTPVGENQKMARREF